MDKQIEYYKSKLEFEIDSADLFAMISTGADIVIVDVRKKSAFDIEHIPGAINLPHADITLGSTSCLSKFKLYITYCDGIGCNASTKGAYRMSMLGFNVKEMIGGIDWWKRDGYTTQVFCTTDESNIHGCTC